MRLKSLPISKHVLFRGVSVALFWIIPALPQMASAQFTPMTSVGNTHLELQRALGLRHFTIDTAQTQTTATADSVSAKAKLKSPLVAVLFSAAIPGGGQVYNGSYWKVPIIIGVQAFFLSQWIYNNKQYGTYRSQFADSLATGPPFDQSGPQRQYYLIGLETIRDAYRDQRDSYAWYIAGVYVLSMLDAYVDAELSGFNVSPNLSFSPTGTEVALTFKLRF